MLRERLQQIFALLSGRTKNKFTAETEFLPAALEIIDTPPSPLGRMVGGVIILFLLIALVWASFGTVDIIATAPGKIITSSRTKIIQPFETGVVRAIHVRDGQHVKEGDVLIEIDATINEAERDRVQKEFIEAQLEAARLKAIITDIKNPLAKFTPPAGATPEQITLQKSLLLKQVAEIQAKLAGLDSQIAQSDGNRAAVTAAIKRLEESIPLLQQRNNIRQQLASKGYGSKIEALSTEQDVIEHQHELNAQQGRLAEANGALSALRDQRRQSEAEYLRNHLGSLAEAQQKATSLREQLLQATQKYKLQTIAAPVAGTVQQLSVHTEGGVVTPAQALLAIVPKNDHLEIEAMLSNRDIGFVRTGQDVAVKIDTFNFTKYGLLHGKLLSISQDAIPRAAPVDTNSGQKQGGAEHESSEPRGQELVYATRIALSQSQMKIDDRMVNLAPGMAVTAEIKTGSRPVIEYLLSPIARRSQQAFRER